MHNPERKNFFPWMQLSIILAAVLLYGHTLDVPFYLDDFNSISENHAVRIQELTISSLWDAWAESPHRTRPLPYISFALNYFFHQYDVAGYHLVNIIIHTVTGLVLFLFARLTLETPALRSRYPSPRLVAFCSALLWLVHPIQIQSVTYIVQRMNSMAALFYITAFWSFAKARSAGERRNRFFYYGATVAAWLLAMGSKEIGATLPFLIFIYEWIFFQKGDPGWLKGKLLYIAGLALILIILSLFYLGKNPLGHLLGGYGGRDFSLAERVLTQPRVIFFYVGLLLLPLPGRFGLEHDFVFSTSLFEPLNTILAIGIIAVLLFFALLGARRYPLPAFGVLWFFTNLVIESTVIPLEMVFEHRMYLPSMFFSLLFCGFLFRQENYRKAVLLFFVLCLVFTGAATYMRNSDWRNPEIFWQKNLRTAPSSFRARNNLGTFLMRRGDYVGAKQYFNEAVQLNPFFVPAYNNLGMVSLRQRRLTEAAGYFRKALSYNPDVFEAHLNLGGINAEMRNFPQAMVHMREAVRIRPESAAAHNNLANLLQLQGMYEEAIYHYDEALRYDPQFEDARYNREVALQRLVQQKQQQYP